MEAGALLRAAVEGLDVPAYVHPQNKAQLRKVTAGALDATLTNLLSSFDPVVWDCERASSLFDFDYRPRVLHAQTQPAGLRVAMLRALQSSTARCNAL